MIEPINHVDWGAFIVYLLKSDKSLRMRTDCMEMK